MPYSVWLCEAELYICGKGPWCPSELATTIASTFVDLLCWFLYAVYAAAGIPHYHPLLKGQWPVTKSGNGTVPQQVAPRLLVHQTWRQQGRLHWSRPRSSMFLKAPSRLASKKRTRAHLKNDTLLRGHSSDSRHVELPTRGAANHCSWQAFYAEGCLLRVGPMLWTGLVIFNRISFSNHPSLHGERQDCRSTV